MRRAVLVIDDSATVRGQLGGLLRAAGLGVVTAPDGAAALARLEIERPDVITLDVNMPRMGGLEFLTALRRRTAPPPVIMVSAATDRGAEVTLRALELGAFDFVCKPGGSFSRDMVAVADDLLARIAAATDPAAAPRAPVHPVPPVRPSAAPVVGRMPAAAGFPVVLVGASTGGPRALEAMLAGLGDEFPGALVVAQHMPETFTGVLARRIDARFPLRVIEVERRVPLAPGTCYIARGGADCILAASGGQVAVQPVPADRSLPWHPNVDRLVTSAMQALPSGRLSGVLLTGMGDDGATAFTQLKCAGAKVIAESRESCAVFGMPQRLIARGGASTVLHRTEIGAELARDVRAAAPGLPAPS